MTHNSFSYQGFQNRQRRRKRWLTLVIIAVVAGLGSYIISRYLPEDLVLPPVLKTQSVGGKIISLEHTGSLTTARVDTDARVVYGAAPDLPPAKVGVETYRLTYSSQDARNGQEIQVTGRVYLPVTGSNLPVLAFGPGTTGPGPDCAPSLERTRNKNWGRYDNHLQFYAGQGYAVGMTDYDGREPGQIHHYFVGEMEGRAMLDLVRAMHKIKDERFRVSPAGTEMVLAGYSQGGHAALWADQLNTTYAPELKTKGVIGFAAATDLLKTFYDSAGGQHTTWIPPYVYEAYRDYYSLKLPATALFKEPFTATLAADARTLCIDQVEVTSGRWGNVANIASVYQPEFLAALRAKNLSPKYPELASLLERNLAGAQTTSSPKLILGGRKDNVVHETAQLDLARRLCQSSGASVQIEIHPEATHYTTMRLERAKALAWMNQIRLGQTPGSQCSGYSS